MSQNLLNQLENQTAAPFPVPSTEGTYEYIITQSSRFGKINFQNYKKILNLISAIDLKHSKVYDKIALL